MISVDTKKANESGAIPPVSLLDDVDAFIIINLKGAVNFCVYLLKLLDRSYGYALRSFHKYPLKISSRRSY